MLKVVYLVIYMFTMGNGEVLEVEGDVYQTHNECIRVSRADAREMNMAKGPNKMFVHVEPYCVSIGTVGKTSEVRR